MAIKTEKKFGCTYIQERGPLDTDSYMIFDILNSRLSYVCTLVKYCDHGFTKEREEGYQNHAML